MTPERIAEIKKTRNRATSNINAIHSYMTRAGAIPWTIREFPMTAGSVIDLRNDIADLLREREEMAGLIMDLVDYAEHGLTCPKRGNRTDMKGDCDCGMDHLITRSYAAIGGRGKA
jgi:hypothetical protein